MALQKSGIFQMNKNNIDAFRKKIDKIDNQLRSLFNERAELAKSIGFLKKKITKSIDLTEKITYSTKLLKEMRVH